MTLTVTEPQRPSLEMVRQLTDRRVFEQLLDSDSLTRAEIASRTGISKPTISESVRRLMVAGLVTEGGRQAGAGGRGRAGTACRLRTDTAAALAISIGPDGIVADTFDLRRAPIAHVAAPVPAPADAAVLERRLLQVVQAAVRQTAGTVRSCVVSVAAPVDRRTGRLVQLSYSPFPVGDFDPVRVLGSLAAGVEVDNDVNWAALAEHQHGNAADLDDFVLCYLGAGIGGAVLVEGAIVGGARGMAGELAGARTVGPDGRSRRLFECFADLDLVRPGSEAIDVALVRDVLAGRSAANRRRRDQVADAVAGALSSVVAMLDPQGVLIGGPWGSAPGLIDLVAERIDAVADPGMVLRPAALTDAPYRDGIRLRAISVARRAVAADF